MHWRYIVSYSNALQCDLIYSIPIHASLDGINPIGRNIYKRQSHVDLESSIVLMGMGAVSLGTPGQRLRIEFDTGSAELWIRSNECKSKTCQGLPAFDPSASSTFMRLNHSQGSIPYVDGTLIEGYHAKESLSIGEHAVKDFTILVATNTSGKADISDGTIGLNFMNGSFIYSDIWNKTSFAFSYFIELNDIFL